MGAVIDITFVKLLLSGVIRGSVRDPYALYRCREHFQAWLLRLSGCGGEGCPRCREESCAYGSAFLQPLGNDPATVRRHQKPPVPFAFTFPVLGDRPEFEVGLTLVGTAITHASLLVKAFAGMLGDRGFTGVTAELARVESAGYFGERSPCLTDEGATAGAGPTILSGTGLMDNRILGEALSLSFVTPLKIIQDGAPLQSFSFSVFARALMRRVSALASAYCDREIDDDFRWLAQLSANVKPIGQAVRWTDWREADRRGRYGGLVGDAVFAVNDVEEFIPYLLVGEYLGAGKGAPFGMGRFHLLGDVG